MWLLVAGRRLPPRLMMPPFPVDLLKLATQRHGFQVFHIFNCRRSCRFALGSRTNKEAFRVTRKQLRLEAIASRVEAIASRVEAIASEAIASRYFHFWVYFEQDRVHQLLASLRPKERVPCWASVRKSKSLRRRKGFRFVPV